MKPTYEELEAKCQLQQKKLDAINKLMDVIEGASDLAKSGIEKLEQQLAAVVVENAGLKSAVVRIFNYGYQHGHESTVEGNYVDIHRNDISEYHEDIVAEIAEEQTPATDAAIANIQAQGVDAAIERLIQKFEGTGYIGVPVMVLESFAAKLRQGAAL